MEGLKALRGLKAQSTIPKIVTLLKHADPNVKRDACRTLAVLGDKMQHSTLDVGRSALDVCLMIPHDKLFTPGPVEVSAKTLAAF